jgi:hypothetical protein
MKKVVPHLPSALVILTIFSIGFFLLYTLNVAYIIDENQKIASGFISANAISFEITQDVPLSYSDVVNAIQPQCFLFRREGINLEEFYIFCYSGDLNLNLLSGRQFTRNDLSTDVPLYICGSQEEKDLLNSDVGYGIKVGTIGLNSPSLLDYLRITLPSVSDRQQLEKGTWIIDGNGNTKKSYTELLKLLDKDKVQRIPTQITGTYRREDVNLTLQTILIAAVLCSLFAFLTLTYYWIQCRSNLISVAILLGMRQRHVILILSRKFIPLVCIGLLLGMFCCWPLMGENKIIAIDSILIVFAITLVLLVILYLLMLAGLLHARKKGVLSRGN